MYYPSIYYIKAFAGMARLRQRPRVNAPSADQRGQALLHVADLLQSRQEHQHAAALGQLQAHVLLRLLAKHQQKQASKRFGISSEM